MEYFVRALQNYVNFEGRDTQRQYWMFVLFYAIFYLASMIIDAVLTGGLLAMLFSLALFLPNLAAGVRRLHDTGKSGWLLLIGLIPIVGLILIYFLAVPGEAGPNKFGPDPREVGLDGAEPTPAQPTPPEDVPPTAPQG